MGNDELNNLDMEIFLNPYNVTRPISAMVDRIIGSADGLDDNGRKELAKTVADLAEKAKGELCIFLYSVAIYLDKNRDYLVSMLKSAYTYRDYIGADNIFFVFQQAISLSFRFHQMDGEEVLILKNRLYKWCLEKYAELLKDDLIKIPLCERDRKMVLVISSQVIEPLHGPTKATLDRCKMLMDAGYKVLLINTADLLGNASTMQYCERVMASYVDEYLEKEYLEWKGTKIPFFQCENNMPNIGTITQLINAVKGMKPYFVISIAEGTIFEGLLSKMIPVFSVPMTISELVVSGAGYQACSPNKDEVFYRQLEILGLEEHQTIETVFGFSLMEQKSTRTRQEFGIPKDCFLLTTVGARLDTELDNSFWEMFRKVVAQIPSAKIMLIGDYEIKDEIQNLKDHILPMGYIEDLLSIYDLCNLYVNPHRKGGGTSAVEAMAKGIPVVTDSFGDVAGNVGKDFWAADYDDYVTVIKRYYEDRPYYEEQRRLAKVRADELLSAGDEFMKSVEEFERRFREEE
ncbi:glycosyltransferase family 4 protein [Butyrivibrio sp. VCB2006]|uniref:glycosyltransferase family 4 protein n=1 Tax=Butyrivibrio sp. VCB2006 TaxID=1280679 RepID=UPI0003F7B0ED|nr:glycosyltransferase family 4 protein [Butyrivibrio sp. VCB2006]